MRITIAQGAFLPIPPIQGGAVEKRWFELGKAFARNGHNVFQISKSHPELPNKEVISGVEHLRVRGYSTPQSIVHLKLLDLLYSLSVLRILPDADILISNTFFLPLLCRNPKKGLLYVDVARMPKGQIRFYGRAARLRANSSAVAEAIVKECPKAQDRVKVIPNPLPFVPDSDSLESKEKVILYTGRIHPEKGIDLLLESFRLFHQQESGKDWRLEIAGPHETALGGGGNGHMRRLKELAHGLPIVWHGMVRETDVLNRLYQRASIFAYPSLAEKGETFGLSVLEAMAWGCVPVVSDLACFRDFVKDRENGRGFNHRDSNRLEALANTFSDLTITGNNRAQLQERARNVRKTHSLDSISDAFLDDFKSILSM